MPEIVKVTQNKVIVIEKGGSGKDGLSAYQVAVSNGFVGTEQDWLDSLKGDIGNTGQNGQNGGNFTHDQMIPSDTWNVVHNLGYKPNVLIEDSAGTIVHGEIDYVDNNNLTLRFSAAFAGKAYCS